MSQVVEVKIFDAIQPTRRSEGPLHFLEPAEDPTFGILLAELQQFFVDALGHRDWARPVRLRVVRPHVDHPTVEVEVEALQGE